MSIDYDTLTKCVSSVVIPAIFVVMILIVFLALVWNWNNLGEKIKAFLSQLF